MKVQNKLDCLSLIRHKT